MDTYSDHLIVILFRLKTTKHANVFKILWGGKGEGVAAWTSCGRPSSNDGEFHFEILIMCTIEYTKHSAFAGTAVQQPVPSMMVTYMYMCKHGPDSVTIDTND
eukprot:1316219-Amorphochlora_amoeboformis.AAC.1